MTLPMQAEAARLAAEITAEEANFTTTLIAKELATPRETRLLRRGEYDLPTGEPLQPGILEVMSQFPAEAPRNRLGLADVADVARAPLGFPCADQPDLATYVRGRAGANARGLWPARPAADAPRVVGLVGGRLSA